MQFLLPIACLPKLMQCRTLSNQLLGLGDPFAGVDVRRLPGKLQDAVCKILGVVISYRCQGIHGNLVFMACHYRNVSCIVDAKSLIIKGLWDPHS